jgi:hypothetical protein
MKQKYPASQPSDDEAAAAKTLLANPYRPYKLEESAALGMMVTTHDKGQTDPEVTMNPGHATLARELIKEAASASGSQSTP